MKNYFLIFLAVFITFWLITTANDLPSNQAVIFSSSHFFTWQTTTNFNLDVLLVINILCLPIIIFFLKFLLEKKINKINLGLLIISGLAGITSALPNAGWMLLIALILFLGLMITFNNGWEDMLTTVKLTLFFYFTTLSFLALSGLGIILTITISIFVGALVATIFETLKKALALLAIFLVVLLMAIMDRPSYHN